MSIYWVYVIQAVKYDRLYKGVTQDYQHRIDQHNNGQVASTKAYIPWKLIYLEGYINKTDALIQEKYLKSGSGRELLKRKLKHYLQT